MNELKLRFWNGLAHRWNIDKQDFESEPDKKLTTAIQQEAIANGVDCPFEGDWYVIYDVDKNGNRKIKFSL